MNRRTFFATVLATPFLEGAPKGAIIELRQYWLRNNQDQQLQRTSEFIEKHAIPAGKRSGGEVVGVFANLIAPQGPSLLMVNQYASLAAMEAAGEKLAADQAFTKELDAYYARPGVGYQRVDVTLLRAIDGMPRVEVPPAEAGRAPRVFELRVYESNNQATLRKKVKMFEDGELAIFRRLGMRPVFFGTAMAGTNLPNLTYMLAYDDLAHREKVWRAFVSDPEWLKMRVTPGLSDAEIVSNISNTMLRPLPFSAVR